MKLMMVFFAPAVTMALIIGFGATATTPSKEEEYPSSSSASLRGSSRFLTQKSDNPRQQISCNRNPGKCRAKGSPGPDCCNNKCVNVSTDRLNCGICGKKCKYNEICCRGKCVDPSSDEENCGRCNSRCHKGRSCVLGMCNYAENLYA